MGFKLIPMNLTRIKLINAIAISAFAGILSFTCLMTRVGVEANPGMGSMPDIVSSDVLKRAQETVIPNGAGAGVGKKGLGECAVCRSLVDSFNRGLQQTSRGKFEGGDADWEASRLRSYKDSELRLIEVQENLCNDMTNGKEQCHKLAEEEESTIETWWFKKKTEDVTLEDFLCIQKLKVCCPFDTFGPDCSPCTGSPDMICSKHGTCKGNGTRKGTGKCHCHAGYFGDTCDKCAEGYFKANTSTDENLDCEACDRSCLGHCRDKGPKGCEVCKEGFIWDQDYGCIDIDECLELGSNPCERNTFCVNTESSFTCFQCDKACDGCNGDGPDFCTKCGAGYSLKEGICVDTKTKEQETSMEMSRYATYMGLTLATCIIFRKNIYVASIIGLVVALYIALAEYTVRNSPHNPMESVFRGIVGAS